MPTKADRAKAQRIVAYEVRDPLTEKRKCRWCGLDAPEKAQDGGEYLCPGEGGGCNRWQHEKAFPQGVPGLTQETETCRWCGQESAWASDEDDAFKRCPVCRSDMHPSVAIARHGQALIPVATETMLLRRLGTAAASAERTVEQGWRTVTHVSQIPAEEGR